MNLSTEQHGNTLVVKLIEPRLDAVLAVRFKEGLKTIVDGGADHIILDLSAVGFMDSSGLGAVVGHMKYMGTDRVFEIAGLTPTVEKVFKLTRMDTIFRIFPNVETALNTDNQKAG